ncbi:Arm DNA-binding domain-containing protein [Psychrobacter sp. TAE2020]|uniref:Arm DNA-binding domain-containing protein n=1 Tax=Psychrobacter sp. TAE2020 TaxID=2846762 RepID=UPI001C1028D1|nr:Arm DNA-binding domain-containing protein [Psychrobacter sp. TAE2020]MBU5615735.1 Arm DNA-binding domain-containing protein [Psychrobacter sp. TAE2020]
MPLTHTIINKLTPSEKCTLSHPDKHSDGDGLQLWVRHTDNKVWISAYRWQGKQQSLT